MKTHTTFLISTFLLHTFVSCNKKNQKDLIAPQPTEKSFPLEHPSLIDSSEYEVYSSLLNGFNQNTINVRQVTKKLNRSTVGSAMHFFANSGFKIDSAEFVYAQEINDTSYYLDNKFKIQPKEVQLIPAKEFESLFGTTDIEKGWQNYYAKYGSGYIGFSRVEFNESKTKALVEMSYVYASLGAEGFYIYLEKGSSGWIVIKSILVWMS